MPHYAMFEALSPHLTFAAVAMGPPPTLGVPSPGDAFGGWLLGLLILLAPNALLAWRSHQVLGHWSRYFWQWRRRAWWLASGGTLIVALSAFGLAGALPAWQSRWSLWQAAARAHGVDSTALAWLDQSHADYATLMQVGIIVLLLAGLAALAVGMWVANRTIIMRRRPVVASSEWMMAPPLTRPHSDE